MEMMQFLEADKEQLMSGLAGAGTPEQAQGVLEKEFDRLLLRYNEECTEERVRDAARYMLQAGSSFRMTKMAIACLAGGILFLAGAVLGLAVSAGEGLNLSALLGSIPAAILAGILLFFAGRLSYNNNSSAAASRANDEQQVEIRVNPERVWSSLRAVVLSVDKSLQEARDAVNYEKNQLSASVGNGISPEEADLFSGILEISYSQREENPGDTTVQEMISTVRYYLHRKQVETVEYGGGKREWFELLPGKQDATLRPALVRDGVLIRKGLAVMTQ